MPRTFVWHPTRGPKKTAKLDLPATPAPTREQLMAAMDGKVVGKAAYVGRYHAPTP